MRETQRKGDIGVAQAIATFTKLGLDVSLPLTESATYDLIVDFKNKLYKVQIKYTSKNSVDLRRIYSNPKKYYIKKNKVGDYDWLYIYQSEGKEYLIKKCLEQSTLTLNDKYLLKL